MRGNYPQESAGAFEHAVAIDLLQQQELAFAKISNFIL
jgi:hypothetical protein